MGIRVLIIAGVPDHALSAARMGSLCAGWVIFPVDSSIIRAATARFDRNHLWG